MMCNTKKYWIVVARGSAVQRSSRAGFSHRQVQKAGYTECQIRGRDAYTLPDKRSGLAYVPVSSLTLSTGLRSWKSERAQYPRWLGLQACLREIVYSRAPAGVAQP
eukprot:scaffold92755_cov18-Tisochrysis_lutea.AAC.2